jgi:hypothetical protein
MDQPTTIHESIDTRQRVLLMAIRQALIMALGALEDYLGLDRSIVPRHRR